MGNSASQAVGSVVDGAWNAAASRGWLFTQLTRIPTTEEVAWLRKLEAKLTQKMRSENTDDVALLSRIWESAIAPELVNSTEDFSLCTQSWRSYLGFQRDEPLSDIRGGGRLAGEAILYFCESAKGQMLLQKCLTRRRAALAKSATDGTQTFNSYPLAPAIVNCVRNIGAMFNICTEYGGTVDFTMTEGDIYSLLAKGEEGFFEAVVLSMEIIDSLFEAEGGGYMSFPSVNKRALVMLEHQLKLQALKEWEKSESKL